MSTILLAAALLAEAPDAKEDLLAAIKKLGEASSYAWTSTPKNNAPDAGGQGGRRMGPGPGEGKTEKDGLTWLSSKQGETALEAVVKGDKSAVKTAEGWKASSEFQRGQQGQQRDPAAFMARAIRTWKSPAASAENLAGKTADLKAEADGLYTAALTEEGAKELLSGGGQRPGGQGRAPEMADVKGSVKFWVKDGVLSKFEHSVSGKIKFGEREVAVDRTTTVEIKDVGTAKVEVPDEAKAKLQ